MLQFSKENPWNTCEWYFEYVVSWLKFIENPEVVNMDENVAIKKVQKELEKINSDEHGRYLVEFSNKNIWM